MIERSLQLDASVGNKLQPGDLVDWIETVDLLGDLELAAIMAKRAYDEAERVQAPPSLDLIRVNVFRGLSLLQQGAEPAQYFPFIRRAVSIQGELEPQYPRPYGMQGYIVGTALLHSGLVEEAISQAEYCLAIADRPRDAFRKMAPSPLTKGLSHILLARSLLRRHAGSGWDAQNLSGGIARARILLRHVNAASELLEEADQLHFKAEGLILLSEVMRLCGELGRAAAELDRANDIISDQSFGRLSVDLKLERARHLIENLRDAQGALRLTSEASISIREMGYGRRVPELVAIQEAAGGDGRRPAPLFSDPWIGRVPPAIGTGPHPFDRENQPGSAAATPDVSSQSRLPS
jgi:hypothetical protein